MRLRVVSLAAVVCALLAFAAVGGATSLRASRSVAGARATVVAYVSAVVAGNGRAACSLLTPAAQTEVARANHRSSCAAVIEIGAAFLKLSPAEAAQLRSYAATVSVTLRGDSATVPDLTGGGRSLLIYAHGLWYIASS